MGETLTGNALITLTPRHLHCSTQLNAQHCLDIAEQAARDEHLQLAHAWLLEANRRLLDKDRAKLLPVILEQLVKLKARLSQSESRGMNNTLEMLKNIEPGSESPLDNWEELNQVQKQIEELTADPVDEHAVRMGLYYHTPIHLISVSPCISSAYLRT